MKKKKMKSRLHLIDEYRGFVVINMIAYHAIWDIVYMFGANWQWYKSEIGFFWQQWICWSFILVSGFCWQMGRNPFKRGMMMYAGGMIISLVTMVAMPQSRVVFGILTLLGSVMILMIPLDLLFRKFCLVSNHLKEKCVESVQQVMSGQLNDDLSGKSIWYYKIQSWLGATASFMLFLFTYPVNRGYLGFGGKPMIVLPEAWYANTFTTYLGFPEPGFFSTDYFSIFPWIFLYMTGYFLYAVSFEKNQEFLRVSSNKHLYPRQNAVVCQNIFKKSICPPLGWIGRNALVIYMLHQPVIYGVLYIMSLMS